ncbi:MAG: hypothetical protein V4724_39500 [Pseudomonadota bacterium]
MKIQSFFSNLANVLVKDKVAQVVFQAEIMRPLSSDEIAVISGGPDVENDPLPN